MAHKNIHQANKEYERWLRAELRGDVNEHDLAEKWKKMRSGPFAFLRATYWRWAETILTICPTLASAPAALAVGDIHLENFGTWRDDDGRLVWGVNDFDEAASMPYALDLVRLATSAKLAQPLRRDSKNLCAAILDGYGEGLARPRPFVLDEEHRWLRDLVIVPEENRGRFWAKLNQLKPARRPPAKRYRDALQAAMPQSDVDVRIFPRTAGTGSLGRPRWVGIANWRGGSIVREAKALVPSGWVRAFGRGGRKLYCEAIASGSFRAPDPWYQVRGTIVVRRLSPNGRKIEVKDMPDQLLQARMLQAMGHELANIHLGTGHRRAAIAADLAARPRRWLRDATNAAADFVQEEYRAWRKG